MGLLGWKWWCPGVVCGRDSKETGWSGVGLWFFLEIGSKGFGN